MLKHHFRPDWRVEDFSPMEAEFVRHVRLARKSPDELTDDERRIVVPGYFTAALAFEEAESTVDRVLAAIKRAV